MITKIEDQETTKYERVVCIPLVSKSEHIVSCEQNSKLQTHSGPTESIDSIH